MVGTSQRESAVASVAGAPIGAGLQAYTVTETTKNLEASVDRAIIHHDDLAATRHLLLQDALNRPGHPFLSVIAGDDDSRSKLNFRSRVADRTGRFAPLNLKLQSYVIIRGSARDRH